MPCVPGLGDSLGMDCYLLTETNGEFVMVVGDLTQQESCCTEERDKCWQMRDWYFLGKLMDLAGIWDICCCSLC